MTIPRLMPDTFLWREEGKMQMRAAVAAELGMAAGREGGREGGGRVREACRPRVWTLIKVTQQQQFQNHSHARTRTGLYYPRTLASVRFSPPVRRAAAPPAPNSEQLWNFKCPHLSSDTVYIRAILDYQQGCWRAATLEGKVGRSG